MKGHIVTSEVQTELSVQVVLPNGELKTLRVLVDFGCQAVALANPNVFGEQISEKYESPQRRRLLQADNETPLPGGDEQIDVKIQFTGVVDGSVPLPRVAQYGVSPYLVPNLPWDVVLGHPWGYEHCVSHFARFNCLYSHHPVHPRFWIEDFREVPRTGKPFLVKPIHGKVSRKSVWGVTVLIIGAGAPLPPAPAIVVTPPDGEPPNRVEAEKYISYALTASSVAPVQDRACALELVEFAPEKLARDVLPTRRDGTTWKQSDYGLTPYWAGRVKKQFGTWTPTPTWTPSIGSRVLLRLPVGFHRKMISSPLPRTHPNCIGCARHIIGFPIVFAKFGKKNYELSSWGRSGLIGSGGSPLWRLPCKGITFLGRRLRPVFTRMITSRPSRNGSGPRWRYTWTGGLRMKI